MFGIDPACLPDRTPPATLWADHLTALEAFLAVASQWRVAPSGHHLGLDHGAAKAGFELSGIVMTPELWGDVRLIEAGARDAINGG